MENNLDKFNLLASTNEEQEYKDMLLGLGDKQLAEEVLSARHGVIYAENAERENLRDIARLEDELRLLREVNTEQLSEELQSARRRLNQAEVVLKERMQDYYNG